MSLYFVLYFYIHMMCFARQTRRNEIFGSEIATRKVRTSNGDDRFSSFILVFAFQDILDDPAVVGTIDEETEFNALVVLKIFVIFLIL